MLHNILIINKKQRERERERMFPMVVTVHGIEVIGHSLVLHAMAIHLVAGEMWVVVHNDNKDLCIHV